MIFTTDDLDRAGRRAERGQRDAHTRYLDLAHNADHDTDLAPAPVSIMRRKRGTPGGDHDLPSSGWVNRRTEE